MKTTTKLFLVLVMASAPLAAMQNSVLPCVGCQTNGGDDSYKLNVFVNALCWRPQEEGLDYMIKNTTGAVYVNNGSVERAEFDWNGGFRVGLGYCDPCCPIGVSAYYTRFTTDGCNRLSATYPTVLFTNWSVPRTGFTSEQNAQAKLCFSLNMVDAQVNTVFSPNDCVTVAPALGLQFARIRQNFNINANGGSSGFVSDDAIVMRNTFEGVGPKFGINTNWGSWCGVSLFGSMQLSLLYGKFELSQKETVVFTDDNVDTVIPLNILCNTFHITRPTIDMIIGLQWDYAWDCYDFAFSAGWEQQYFFGQNQWLHFVDDVYPGINVPAQGDLVVQGLTVSLNVSF